MQKQEKSRKPLIIGIIAAVVILAILLILLLTQCTGGQGGGSSKPAAESTSEEVPTYQLYWNADRAEYDGKSEAGMSSRMPEEDGYFHVRFILDGEEVVLKVADRKLINAIDVQDVMGLEFDDNGIVIGVVSLDDMPLEKVGWQFYVQSAARTMIKLNSSESLNGMEVLLEDLDPNRIWDMSGLSGPVGCVSEAIEYDKIMAVQNLAGEITHVFIYQRPNYMLTHEDYCEHCKETVTWYEWTKTAAVPLTGGHYQLMTDVQLTAQPGIQEDAKLCLDLNGHRIDGKSGARAYAMFNAGITFAVMDTSEDESGVIAAHGKGDQGMVVWVRYGAFYLYGGTLDASDATTVKNGTAVECGSGKFFYMNGGKIIGGTSTYSYNEEKNTYGHGLGGALSIGGKFVMNDGIIENGYAQSAVIYKDGKPNSWQRGIGGNIYFSSSAEFEMNGGTIRNGRADNLGGNIYADGKATLTINGGTIAGGVITGKGKNGGSIFLGSKTTTTINGGSIYGGVSYNCGGNVYLNGTLTMNGGYIGGGVCYNYDTRKVKPAEASANLFIVNGKFTMWGGTIVGGVSAIDSKKNGTQNAVVSLYGWAKIDGSTVGRNLSISGSGDGVKVNVGNMYKGAKVGVNTTIGIFTEPTKEEYKQYFYSDIEGADIVYYSERLALGRISCVCGNSKGETVSESHINGCDGKVLLWAPWSSTNSVPTSTGNYYLLKDVTTTGQSVVSAGKDVKLDLNGKNITLQVRPSTQDGFRLYRADNGAKLTLTDTTTTPGTLMTVMPGEDAVYPGKTVKTKAEKDKDGNVVKEAVYFTEEEMRDAWTAGNFGMLLWVRGGEITVHNGIFDGSNLTGSKNGMVISVGNNTVTDAETGEKTVYKGVLNMYGGTVIGGFTTGSGNVSVSSGATMNLYGGTITDGRSIAGGNILVDGTLNMYGGTVTNGLVDRSEEPGSDGEGVDGGMGGNINVVGTMNMYGGTVSNGNVVGGKKGGGHGGNIHVHGTLNATGGVISGGTASGMGGNIGAIIINSLINLDGVQVLDGTANVGGNVAVAVRSNKGLHILGDTVISGGSAKNGGNIGVSLNSKNTTKDQDQVVVINGATIVDGTAQHNGGNIYLNNPTADSFKVNEKTGKEYQASYKIDMNVTVQNATISGGISSGGTDHAKGGNLFVGRATVTLDNTKVTDGQSIGPDNAAKYAYGGNVFMENNAQVYLKNGSVVADGVSESSASSWYPGGNFYISNGLLDITASTISGGDSNDGHNIYVNYDGAVNLHSGKIENTVTGNTNIMMQGGTLTMDDGSIINAEGMRSRNINTNKNAKSKYPDDSTKWPTIIINGGTISGGDYAANGGNIFATYGSTVELNGGKVVDGHSDDSAGNIYSNETVNINGGEISGGTATKNPKTGNLFMVNGALDVTGGVIDGGVSQAYTVKITMSGKPVINSTNYGITVGSNDIQITGILEEGSSVWVDGSGIISNVTDKANQKYFHTLHEAPAEVLHISEQMVQDDPVGLNAEDQGKLFIGGYYCICGQSKNHLGDCGGKKLAWAPYTDNDTLPTTSGNWYLTQAVELTADVRYEKAIAMNLDLNDKTVTQSGNGARVFRIRHASNKYAATIGVTNVDKDSNAATGKIVATSTSGGQDGSFFWITQSTHTVNIYGGIYDASGLTMADGKDGTIAKISGSSTMNIYGGEFIGGTAGRNTNGGGFKVGAGSTMNIYGGLIRGGKSVKYNGNGGQGGNIDVRGTLNVYGGEIRDGVSGAGSNSGMNIMATGKNATLNICGGTIAGGVGFNTHPDVGTPKLSLSGSPVIDKNLTSEGVEKPLYGLNVAPLVGEAGPDVSGLKDGASIYVYASGRFGVNASEKIKTYFHSEDASRDVILHNGKDVFDLYLGKTYCLCGASEFEGKAHQYWCDETEHGWIAWDGKAILDSGYYYLDDGRTTGQTSIGEADKGKTPVEVHAVIDLNGNSWKASSSRAIRLEKGSLSITDTSISVPANEGTAKGSVVGLGASDSTSSGVVLLTSNTEFNIYAGNITLNLKDDGRCNSNGGLFKIPGKCVVNMYSGTLTNGSANYGGNTYVEEGGTFNLYGGTVSGGTAAQGGNVYVESGAAFNVMAHEDDTEKTAVRLITSGTASGIVSGKANSDALGGNIYNKGTLNIQDSSVVTLGKVDVKSVVKKSDGSNRTAYGYGGNIASSGGTVTIDNSKITDGSIVALNGLNDSGAYAWAPGGNIYVTSGCTMTVSGGTEISGGVAYGGAGDGMNLYVTSGSTTVNLESCTIKNTVDATVNNRANILLENGTLNIKTGANILNEGKNTANIATNNSGSYAAKIVMTGGLIDGGTGHNVLLRARDSFEMSGGIVRNGKAPTESGALGRTRGGNFYLDGGTSTVPGGKLSISGEAQILGGEADGRGLKDTEGKALDSGYGGSIYINDFATLEMTGGKISGGKAYSDGDGSLGGNIGVGANSAAAITGGTVENGEAKRGGNIGINSGSASITIGGTAIVQNGVASEHGGNLALNVRGCNSFIIEGNAQILNGQAATNGGNIYIDTWATKAGEIVMNSGTVSGGTAGSNGANVYMTGSQGCKFTMNSGTISGGTASSNIYVGVNGSFVMNDGVVESTAQNMRNLYIKATASAAMNGGEIKNAKAEGNGANVYVEEGAEFTISGGSIYGGDTKDSGGNIASYGILNIAGGKIYGGSCSGLDRQTTNVFVVRGNLNISGGEIWGGFGVTQAGKNAVTTVTVKNAPVIDKSLNGSTNTNVPTISLELNKAVDMDVSGLTGGKIYVSGTVGDKIAVNAKATALDYIFSEVTYGEIEIPVDFVETESALYLGRAEDMYCLCGASKDGNDYECQCEGDERVWVQWTDKTKLPIASGNYYLAYNVSLTADTVRTPATGAEIAIDLRGKTITLENDERLYKFEDNGNATVIITDSAAEPGQVVQSNTTASVYNGGIMDLKTGNTFELYRATLDASGWSTKENGAAIAIRKDAEVIIHSGTIKGGTVAKTGGAIWAASGSKLTMKDGDIVGGSASQSGGAVYVTGTTFTMEGGTISGGWSKEGGGNVRVNSDSTFTMSGGTIKGGKTGGNSADEGFATKNDVNLFAQNSTVIVSGGEIWGGTYVQRFVDRNASLQLSGTPVIDGRLNVNAETGMTAIPSLVLAKYDSNKNDNKTPELPELTITAALEAGSSIGIYGADANMRDTLFSTANAEVNAASVKYFFEESGIQNIYVITQEYVDCSEGKFTTDDIGKLYIGQIHCVCGGLLADHGTGHELCDGTPHVWTSIDRRPTYTDINTNDKSYYFYLRADVMGLNLESGFRGDNANSLGGATAISNRHMYLDLNGYNMGSVGSRVFVARNGNTSGCSLNILNTKQGDESVIQMTGAHDQGALFWLNGGTVGRVFNVKIESDITNTSGHNGGLFAIGGAGSRLYMKDVTVVSNSANASGYANEFINVHTDAELVDCTLSGANGTAPAIRLAGTSIRLENCEITGNVGGGVLVERGTLTLAGTTTITGNTSDGTAAKNLFVTNGSSKNGYVVLEDGFSGSFGLSGDADRNLVNSITTWDNAIYTGGKITVDDSAYQIMIWDNGLGLTSTENIIQCACGGKAVGVGDHQCKKLVFTPWKEIDSLPASGNWYLTDHVNIKTQGVVDNAKTLNIDLNGKNITSEARVYLIDRDATLSITDSTVVTSENGKKVGTITGAGTSNAGTLLFTVNGADYSYVNFNLYDGVITYAGTGSGEGGVVDVGAGVTFNMYGGSITDGKSKSNGGNIVIRADGVMNLYAGNITGGQCGYSTGSGSGGNICIKPADTDKDLPCGTFRMYGGTVSGGKSTRADLTANTANTRANVFSQGRFEISGGTITGKVTLNAGSAYISGNPSITGGNAFNVENSTVGANIQIGVMTDGAEIQFFTSSSNDENMVRAVIAEDSNVTSENITDYFSTLAYNDKDNTYPLVIKDGKVYINNPIKTP